jgi:uncharacterized protein
MCTDYLLIRKLLKESLLLVLCGHWWSVPARSEADDVMARVNGETIGSSLYERSRRHLERNLGRQFSGKKLKAELAKQEAELLKALIDEEVLRQRAKKLGLVPETELIEYLDQMRRDNGFDDLESLERSLAAKGVDPREFKHDSEQRLVRAHLLETDAHRLTKGLPPDSRQEVVDGQLTDVKKDQKLTRSQNVLYDYTQALRRSSIIEVKHGFIDTGVAYTGELNQDLLIAARNGDMPRMRSLLADGANPNAVAANGYSALMHAAEMGHKDSVEALVAGGGQPNAKNNKGDTALLLATIEGYKDIVTVLLANKADADVQDADGVTPLMHACTDCKTEIVGSLLEPEISINSADKIGRTALIAATVEGCSTVITALLKRGADPNLADSDGRTALTYSVESGRKDLIQALLRKGARVDARDNDGKIALIYAVIAGRLDLLQQLLAEQADVNAADNESQTPLMYAAASGSQQMVQTLLDSGADAKAQTWSLRLVRYNAVGLLIDPAEATQPSSSSNLTALDIAQKMGRNDVVETLKKAESKGE